MKRDYKISIKTFQCCHSLYFDLTYKRNRSRFKSNIQTSSPELIEVEITKIRNLVQEYDTHKIGKYYSIKKEYTINDIRTLLTFIFNWISIDTNYYDYQTIEIKRGKLIDFFIDHIS